MPIAVGYEVETSASKEEVNGKTCPWCGYRLDYEMPPSEMFVITADRSTPRYFMFPSLLAPLGSGPDCGIIHMQVLGAGPLYCLGIPVDRFDCYDDLSGGQGAALAVSPWRQRMQHRQGYGRHRAALHRRDALPLLPCIIRVGIDEWMAAQPAPRAGGARESESISRKKLGKPAMGGIPVPRPRCARFEERVY